MAAGYNKLDVPLSLNLLSVTILLSALTIMVILETKWNTLVKILSKIFLSCSYYYGDTRDALIYFINLCLLVMQIKIWHFNFGHEFCDFSHCASPAARRQLSL